MLYQPQKFKQVTGIVHQVFRLMNADTLNFNLSYITFEVHVWHMEVKPL